MFIALPNLDDRRWSDLVDEARSLLPVYAPAWTNFNESDPGITLIDLLAWITEGDVYRTNRISDAHRLSFLALLGIYPTAPQPALLPVQATLVNGGAPLQLPAGTECTLTTRDDRSSKCRLIRALDVLGLTLIGVQIGSSGKLRDVTSEWQRRATLPIFGDNPQAGDALYLAFTGAASKGAVLSLYFEFAGAQATRQARNDILDELASRAAACPPKPPCGSIAGTPPLAPSAHQTIPPHHSVVLAWEIQNTSGVWTSLDDHDDTRAMTLSGTVSLSFPADTTVQPIFIRCRLVSGSYDAAPEVTLMLANTGEAEQSTPVVSTWSIAGNVTVAGSPAPPSTLSYLQLECDAGGQITSLNFTSQTSNTLPVTVLQYTAAAAPAAGSLTLVAVRLGVGTGAPFQLLRLVDPLQYTCDPSIFTVENGVVRQWSHVQSFVESGPADAAFLMSAERSQILFGDGEHGRVPPPDVPILATFSQTDGTAGNVLPLAVQSLDPGPHNTALVDLAQANARLASITNPVAASGGADAESVKHAEGRAAIQVYQPTRAVTLADCETLALRTPGTILARAAAVANTTPGMQCYVAPGMITVVIVPFLPLGRPVPSPGLRAAVVAYLRRRSVLGTRIEVTGPDYLEVAVSAAIKALTGQNKAMVRAAAIARLQLFLDPLLGGPDGTGWPLGRTVYISEVLDTLAQVQGVDYVSSLTLQAAGCGAQCGDLCLNPFALTVSGAHSIEVS